MLNVDGKRSLPAAHSNLFQVLVDAYQRIRSLPDELVEVNEQLWQLAKVIFCEPPATLESWTLTRCDDPEQGCLEEVETTLRTYAARKASGKCADHIERSRARIRYAAPDRSLRVGSGRKNVVDARMQETGVP